MNRVDPNLKKRAVHRANIIQGQMKGLIQAIKKEKYCPLILYQSLAIQKSLKSMDRLLLENHIKTHVKAQMQNKNINKATKELLDIYNLANN